MNNIRIFYFRIIDHPVSPHFLILEILKKHMIKWDMKTYVVGYTVIINSDGIILTHQQ